MDSRDPEGEPQDVAVVKEHSGAEKAEADALTQRTEAAAETTRARETAKTFEQIAHALADAAADQDVAAYSDDGDAGWQDYVRLDAAAKGAKEELHRNQQVLRGAAEKLSRHAATENHARLTIPVRQQIIELSSEQSAEHATQWLAALQPRKKNLSDEISEVTRHPFRLELVPPGLLALNAVAFHPHPSGRPALDTGPGPTQGRPVRTGSGGTGSPTPPDSCCCARS